MSTENETWGDYSKLVLKELERLNDNYEKMREDIDSRFKEMNNVLSDFKNTEKIVFDQKGIPFLSFLLKSCSFLWTFNLDSSLSSYLGNERLCLFANIADVHFLRGWSLRLFRFVDKRLRPALRYHGTGYLLRKSS
jgi:hypothetical protein